MKRAFAVLLMLILGPAAAVSMSACKKEPMSEAERRMKAPPPDLKDVERYLAGMRKRGHLREVDPESNTAYVMPHTWVVSSYNLRKLDAYALAQYCGLKSASHDYRVTIKFYGTDKAVATWDKKFGYMPAL